MSARGKARKRAVDVLYEADLRGLPPLDTLRDRITAADPRVPQYTADLVEGIVGRLDRLDQLIGEYSEGWSLERMPPVDKAILRVAAYELLYLDEVPDGVAISEGVRLATELCGPETPPFVNGLLSKLLALKPQVTATD